MGSDPSKLPTADRISLRSQLGIPSTGSVSPEPGSSVLLVVECATGGAGMVVTRLAENLQRLDCAVGVIYSNHRIDPMFRREIPRLEGRGVVMIEAPLHPYRGLRGMLASARILKEHAQRFDVTHLHGAWAGIVGRIVLRKSDHAVVYSPHGGAFHPRRGFLYVFARFLERALARRTDAYVVSSPYEMNRLRSIVGDGRRIFLISHGRDDLGAIASKTRSSPIRFGVVGRLVREKRPDLALAAFELARREVKGIKLAIIGEGPLHVQLLEKVWKRGLVEHVDITGFMSDKRDIYRSVDVVVLPSDYESASLVATEAQGFGIPAISTDSGGAGASVVNEINGLLVPKGSATAIAQAMVSFATKPGLLKECSRGALSSAQCRETWDQVVRRYCSLYEEI